MKRLKKKNQKVTKGMPSAVLLSILIHAALFLLAGMLVVFTVVKKEEQKFEPPKAVDRPKMKLKKPKVKIKKTSKPKPTTRIVTKMNRANMPDIQLPEMSGMSSDISGGLGGFDMMPDFEADSLFGGEQSIGNDFVGTFYDMKRNRTGRTMLMDPDKYIRALTKFVRGGWNTASLSQYYQSPRKLYATNFAVPPVQAILAPRAFGEPESGGYCFAVHYEGKLVYTEDITFRFWGLGDDVLVVRVDGKVVLNAPYPRNGGTHDTQVIAHPWQTSSAKSHMFWLGDQLSVVGDWITLKAGVPLNMEVLVGEVAGGLFQALLVVEVKGEKYDKNPTRNGPILPIFKTAPLSIDQVENIHADLDAGDASVTNGPVFCDYVQPERTKPYYTTSTNKPSAPIMYEKSTEREMRAWSARDGRQLEAKFITGIGDKAVLKTARGKQVKIPVSQLSPEDRRYMEFESPPEFLLNFSKNSNSVTPPEESPYVGSLRPLQITDMTFGVRLKQRSTKTYPHELRVEYFAFGEEVDGNNYVLLDRQASVFTPDKENQGSHSFYSKNPIRIQTTAIRAASPMRGTKYGGFLITVTDEQGRIIQYKTSHKWLFESIETLKKLPVGKHFDKSGNRVGPPRPTQGDRPSWV